VVTGKDEVLIAVTVMNTDFCDVMLCRLLRVGKFLPVSTASHTRRQCSSSG